MARILMVSKPVTPPWNDSSKNLVRDLASHMRRHAATVMVERGAASALPRVAVEAVYGRRTGGFAPALADNARVMARLLLGPGHDLWHFFFAPNARSSQACAFAARVRRVRTVQTVCSAPAPGADLKRLLFADRTIVLSRHTEALALAAGVPHASLRRIPPAVAPLDVMDEASRRSTREAFGVPADVPLLVYPGDLEFSGAAELVLRAHALHFARKNAWLVLACRAKTARAQEHDQRLRGLAHELGCEASVRFVSETPRIHALLGAADVVALPADTLYAKMDLPLVLIESMLLARPVVVAAGTPAAELAIGDAALAVAPEVEATAHAIGSVLFEPHAARALGARARQAAIERFHPKVVVDAYEALYDELLA